MTSQATTEFLKLFKAARRVSAPIVRVSTPDAASTINLIASHCAGSSENQYPVICWDVSRGFWTPKGNHAGEQQIAKLGSEAEDCHNASVACELALKLDEYSLVFILNSHKFFSDVSFLQAVWNCRDEFKQDRRTLVLLGPDLSCPVELSNDVVLLTEDLPTPEELAVIVQTQYKNAGLKDIAPEVLTHAVEALCGLNAFQAEQETAMSLTKSGVDLKALWRSKRKAIEQMQGLKIETEDIQLSDVKDADNVVSFILAYLKNVSGILFIDEIEKAMAGAAGDTSGVSQKMHGGLLSWMSDTKAKGILLTGIQGTGKSMTAKAAGTAEKKPVIRMDLAAMESKYVGDSTANLSGAFKTVDAVCQGRVLVIATSNNPGILSPELRSRFRQGTFFFDNPSKAGRLQLWSQYLKTHLHVAELQSLLANPDTWTPGFNDEGWTGREIMSVCELAHDLGKTIAEASKYIVPLCKSNPDDLKRIRSEAKGRYISASKSGIYSPDSDLKSDIGRKVELEG